LPVAKARRITDGAYGRSCERDFRQRIMKFDRDRGAAASRTRPALGVSRPRAGVRDETPHHL